MSGFTSEASMRYSAPSTPPYTPRVKRRLSRSDSPASVRSTVRPTETASPTKKPPKKKVLDDVSVEELTEADLGYIADIEVIYPHELEEADTESENELEQESNKHIDEAEDDSDSHDNITEQLSRLGCDDKEEASFERKRKEKHARRRAESRIFKRPHSLIVNPGAEVMEFEDMNDLNDHDLPESARRLRRRTRGPDELVGVPSDGAESSTGSAGRASSLRSRHVHSGKGTPRILTPPRMVNDVDGKDVDDDDDDDDEDADDDEMDIDEVR